MSSVQQDFKIRGYTVAQSPNPPLATALAALVLGALLSDGAARDCVRGVFFVAITIWAYEEAANGVNGFRKALGVVSLLLIAVAIAREISRV